MNDDTSNVLAATESRVSKAPLNLRLRAESDVWEPGEPVAAMLAEAAEAIELLAAMVAIDRGTLREIADLHSPGYGYTYRNAARVLELVAAALTTATAERRLPDPNPVAGHPQERKTSAVSPLCGRDR